MFYAMYDQESSLILQNVFRCIFNFKKKFFLESKHIFIALNVAHKMQDSFVFSLLECRLYTILLKWIKYLVLWLCYIFICKVYNVFKEVAANLLLLHQNYLNTPCTVARLQTHNTFFCPVSRPSLFHNFSIHLTITAETLVFFHLSSYH